MRRLTILYDATCGVCSWAKYWMLKQPVYFRLEFLAAGCDEAKARYPKLFSVCQPEELIVVDDEGGVYKGGDAWVICLYALRNYREWSFRLARPTLIPLARKAFKVLSTNRHRLSRFLNLPTDATLAERLERIRLPACSGAAGA